MKYPGKRSVYGVFLILFLGYVIWGVYKIVSRWGKVTDGTNILVCILLFPFVCLIFVLLYRFVRRTSYAMIQDDGIHVFSQKQEELAFIPWKSVKMCKQVASEGRFTYLMLIFQYNATYAKRPVAVKNFAVPTYEEVRQHRLDECMDKLARGELTEEEFRQIPYLLLVPGKKRMFEHCLKLWRTAKTEET